MLKELKKKIENIASEEEAIEIVQKLVSIPSHWAQSDREKPIAEHIKSIFEKEGIECYFQEVYPGRPNIIGVLRGTGEGKSVMLNGHIDTVPPFGMDKPFDAKIKNNRIYGRGSTDMKSGVGMMFYAMILLKRSNIKLKGDVYFAGVIDEDAAGSAGTRYIIENGPKTDYAIVGEPTKLFPVTAHKGIDYFTANFKGVSVHSSTPENGANAVLAACDFVSRVENTIMEKYKNLKHELCGSPTLNVGLIKGSAQANEPFLNSESETFAGIIPDVCNVYIDVRWIPGQTVKGILKELQEVAEQVMENRDDIEAKVEYIDLPRPAMEINSDNPLVKSIRKNGEYVLDKDLPVKGEAYWGDSGLLNGIGNIPTIMFGPGNIGCAHSDDEFVKIDELKSAAEIYAMTLMDICGISEEGDNNE